VAASTPLARNVAAEAQKPVNAGKAPHAKANQKSLWKNPLKI